MDYSADFHRQLLQLQDQLLAGAGTDHSWTSTDSLSSNFDSEQNFPLRDLNPPIPAIAADSFASAQCCHGGDQRFADILEDEASVSVPSSKFADDMNENFRKNSRNYKCGCSSGKPMMPEPSNSLEFDRSLPFTSYHPLQHARTTCRLTNMLRLGHEITKQQKPAQSVPKRARVEPRALCPPLKIRKEKLGDRIAALQQLVAPFGKTDTASVLMEAINYINFLQNQVEMLTHSYAKSHRIRNYKAMCRDELEEGANRDLKGRGLCVVPLACISELPEDIGGGNGGCIWPQLVNFSRRIF